MRTSNSTEDGLFVRDRSVAAALLVVALSIEPVYVTDSGVW